MSGTFLLDTNAVVALLNGDAAIEAFLDDVEDAFIPSTALGELYFGAENSARVETNMKRIDEFADRRTVLVCDRETARQYGRIRKQLQAKGRPIPENDIWIAAIAKQYALTVLTSDKHFEHVDELAVQAW